MTISNIININLKILIIFILLLVLVLIFFYFETEGQVIKKESSRSQTFLKVKPIDPNSDGGKNNRS
jgi:hypothetical protein